MPLDLSLLKSHISWSRDRLNTPLKLINAKYIQRFNETAFLLKDTVTSGSINYYELSTTTNSLTYIEGTPLFYCFKLVPNNYFIYTYDETPYWLNTTPNNSITNQLLLSGLSKYPISVSDVITANNYILVLLQRHDDQLDFIQSISKWAIQNKHTVIFKLHILSMSITSISDLEHRYGNKYVKFCINASIYELSKCCKAVWTANSGAAMVALTLYKPVCYFLKDYDHTYGPIAKFCNTVEEAAASYIVDKALVDQYLTWYYNIFVINLKADNYVDKMRARIVNYFTYNYSMQELFSEDSAFK